MASAKDDKQFKYDAGNTLLALREKAGMTQPELAEKIHVEPNSVHRYEKGERQMSLHTAYEASVAFGVPMESLIPDSYKENRQEEEKQSEKEEKAEKKPSPVLEEAIKQLLMLDPKYQDLIVSEINTLTLNQWAQGSSPWRCTRY